MIFEKIKKDFKGAAEKVDVNAKDLGMKIDKSVKDLERAKAAKILSDVKPENAFLFSISEGVFTGKRALNLDDLREELATVDLKSVEFHLHRKDFENWIKYLGDEILALQIGKVRIMPFDDERTREKIVEIISKKIEQLKALASSP